VNATGGKGRIIGKKRNRLLLAERKFKLWKMVNLGGDTWNEEQAHRPSQKKKKPKKKKKKNTRGKRKALWCGTGVGP